MPAGLIPRAVGHEAFHHDKGAIDDHPEVDGTETEQIGRNSEPAHAGHGADQRKRNDGRDDQRRPPVTDDHDQNADHQKRTDDKVFLDRSDGAVRQCRPDIIGFKRHAFGKGAANIGKRSIDGGQRGVGTRSHAHHDDADNDLALTIPRDRPKPCSRSHGNTPDIPQEDGGAVGVGPDRDGPEILERTNQPAPDDDLLFLAMFDPAAAGCGVVAVHGPENVIDRHTERQKAGLIERHLKGLFCATVDIDVHDTRNQLQLRRDRPCHQTVQIHQGITIALDL